MTSKIELNVYKFLQQFDLPFVCNETWLPIVYRDKNGAELKAKSDAHLPIYGTTIYLEIKDSTLNSKTSRKTADNAMARLDPDRYAANPSYYQTVNGWNHSACKFSLVKKSMTESNEHLLLIFDKPPKKTSKCDTPALIEKYQIEYLTKETFRHILALKIFEVMPPSPPRADGLANFHTIDTLVPLRSGKLSDDMFSKFLCSNANA